MRTLSLTFREQIHAQESGLVPIFLVTITHPDLVDGPIRLSTDPTTRLSDSPVTYGTVSQGLTHIFVPMEILLADEKDATPPAQRIRISDIDPDLMFEIVGLLRGSQDPATVRIDMVHSSDVDAVEIQGADFDLTTAKYDATSIDISLTVEALVTEPFPYGTFNPAQFPGLF